MVVKKWLSKIHFKDLRFQVSSPLTPTINLVDYGLEEEVIASVPVTEDVDQYVQPFTYFLNGDGNKYFISLPLVSQSTYVSSCLSSAFLPSSIQTLSTFPDGPALSLALSQLYEDLTSTFVSITYDSM